MRYPFILLTLLSVLSLPTGAACAAGARPPTDLVLPKVEFSATDVQETGPLLIRQTIHYADGKLRIERGHGFSDTILDLTTQTQYLLMPNHTYLVLPMDDDLFRRFIPHSPKMSDTLKVGRQRIQGLETTKYAFGEDGSLDAAGHYWLTDTSIMIRREYDDGVFGQNVHHLEYLTDIAIGKQPEALFSIPADYKLAK
jgi:hypothetical protein